MSVTDIRVKEYKSGSGGDEEDEEEVQKKSLPFSPINSDF